jgi:MYXO-CTERM domain-containing protein
VVRELLSAWAVGFPLIVDYDLRDDGTDPTNAEHNFGLLQNDYGDKPSAVAVRTLSKASAGRTLVATLDLEPTTLHAMRLDGATDVMLVVWAERGSVPVTVPKTATGIDMNGATIDLSSRAFTANADDGPRYVTIDKPVAPDAGPDATDATTDASGTDASHDGATTNDASANGNDNSSSGCGCAIVGERSNAPFGAIAFAALAALFARRKSATEHDRHACSCNHASTAARGSTPSAVVFASSVCARRASSTARL